MKSNNVHTHQSPSHFQINITIPTRMKPAPAANRAETGSFKIKTERRRVTTMLALSMEATYDTGPSFMAR